MAPELHHTIVGCRDPWATAQRPARVLGPPPERADPHRPRPGQVNRTVAGRGADRPDPGAQPPEHTTRRYGTGE